MMAYKTIRLIWLFTVSLAVTGSAVAQDAVCSAQAEAEYAYSMSLLINRYERVALTTQEFEKERTALLKNLELILEGCQQVVGGVMEHGHAPQAPSVATVHRTPASRHQPVARRRVSSERQPRPKPRRPLCARYPKPAMFIAS